MKTALILIALTALTAIASAAPPEKKTWQPQLGTLSTFRLSSLGGLSQLGGLHAPAGLGQRGTVVIHPMNDEEWRRIFPRQPNGQARK